MGLDCFIWGIGIKMHARGPASTVNLKCPASHPPQVQPETLAVIKWMQNYNFILSANLHGGAVVANYPFDKSRDGRIRGRTTYSATPDDKIFRKVRDRFKFPDVTHISYRHCLLCGYENTWMNGPRVLLCVMTVGEDLLIRSRLDAQGLELWRLL